MHFLNRENIKLMFTEMNRVSCLRKFECLRKRLFWETYFAELMTLRKKLKKRTDFIQTISDYRQSDSKKIGVRLPVIGKSLDEIWVRFLLFHAVIDTTDWFKFWDQGNQLVITDC